MKLSYLKTKSYYTDLYDLHTIEECIIIENKKADNSNLVINNKKITIEEAQLCQNVLNDLHLYFYKGNRYKDRHDFIEEWMFKDKEKQDKYNNAKEPTVFCKSCDTPLFIIHKILEDYVDEPLQVLFMFECPDCKKRACYYEDSSEKIFEEQLCPKCNFKVERSHKEKKDILLSITKCTNCEYIDIDEFDAKKSKKERRERKFKEKKILDQYRSKYCLSDEEGASFNQEMLNMEGLSELVKEMNIKKIDPVYKFVDKIRKLTVFELEEYLTKALKKAKFVKLSMKEPDIEKGITISFSIQDSDSKRSKQESSYDLTKLLRKSLKETNWQLMTDGITYRLGLLSGRLRGYETEEELYKLAKKLYKSDSSRLDYRL